MLKLEINPLGKKSARVGFIFTSE